MSASFILTVFLFQVLFPTYILLSKSFILVSLSASLGNPSPLHRKRFLLLVQVSTVDTSVVLLEEHLKRVSWTCSQDLYNAVSFLEVLRVQFQFRLLTGIPLNSPPPQWLLHYQVSRIVVYNSPKQFHVCPQKVQSTFIFRERSLYQCGLIFDHFRIINPTIIIPNLSSACNSRETALNQHDATLQELQL